MSFLFSGLISIMSTDRGTIISPHISPTLSIDTDSKKSVINLVQNFPKARALPAPRPACVLWKWLSKSVIVNCVIACTAAVLWPVLAWLETGVWPMQIITKRQLGTKLMLSNYRHERMRFFLIGANPFNGELLSAVWPDTQEADLRQWWNSALLSLVNSKF